MTVVILRRLRLLPVGFLADFLFFCGFFGGRLSIETLCECKDRIQSVSARIG